MTLYTLVRAIHIATAVLAMGAHFAVPVILKHVIKHPESGPGLMPLADSIGKFPHLGGMVMLLSGTTMVLLNPARWTLLTQFWIIGALVLFFAIIISGAMAGSRHVGRFQAAVKVGSTGDLIAATRDLNRLVIWTGVLLTGIVLLMIFKP